MKHGHEESRTQRAIIKVQNEEDKLKVSTLEFERGSKGRVLLTLGHVHADMHVSNDLTVGNN